VQSFDSNVLKKINRTQTKEYFERIYKLARGLEIETINVELMGGLPGQTYESFMSDLNYLINLDVDSIHIYSYMQTPQTPLGKIGHNKVDNDLKIKMIQDGEKLLEEHDYEYYGDDYSRKRKNRNLSISRINRLGVGKLALGVSAAGFIPSQNWQMLAYLNLTDLKAYFQELEKDNFPIDKFYFFKKDETFRALLINNLRMLDSQDVDERLIRYLKKKFKKELDLIKEKCEVLETTEKLIVKDWLFNSKYLYSPKILKKCQRKINEEFSHISDRIEM
jgi:oxygen-independent coproporphyrinogen-3 oxidase